MNDAPTALTFTIGGIPQPQPRPRFVNGRVVSTASKRVKLWRGFVIRAAREAMFAHGWRIGGGPFMGGTLRLDVVFTFPTPVRYSDRIGRYHTHKPDRDNLEKGLMDALQEANVFKDDAQVATGEVVKLWGAAAATVVVLRSVEPRIAPAPRAAPAWLAGE